MAQGPHQLFLSCPIYRPPTVPKRGIGRTALAPPPPPPPLPIPALVVICRANSAAPRPEMTCWAPSASALASRAGCAVSAWRTRLNIRSGIAGDDDEEVAVSASADGALSRCHCY